MDAALQQCVENDELRYVTQHFQELQGLRLAPVWMSFIVLSILEYAHVVTRWKALVLILGLVVLALALSASAGRWYRLHYGFVAPRHPGERVPSQLISIMQPDQRTASRRSNWFMVCLFLVFGLWLAPLFAHSYRNYSNFGLLTLIFFVLPKTRLVCAGSIPLRAKQLLAIGGSVALIILQIFYDLERLDTWTGVGASAAVVLSGCLYDHWLLNRLLCGRPLEDPNA